MLGDDLDAASAGFRVGYEDPAYFSRDYKKLFGAPPLRDIARLRGILKPEAEKQKLSAPPVKKGKREWLAFFLTCAPRMARGFSAENRSSRERERRSGNRRPAARSSAAGAG